VHVEPRRKRKPGPYTKSPRPPHFARRNPGSMYLLSKSCPILSSRESANGPPTHTHLKIYAPTRRPRLAEVPSIYLLKGFFLAVPADDRYILHPGCSWWCKMGKAGQAVLHRKRCVQAEPRGFALPTGPA